MGLFSCVEKGKSEQKSDTLKIAEKGEIVNLKNSDTTSFIIFLNPRPIKPPQPGSLILVITDTVKVRKALVKVNNEEKKINSKNIGQIDFTNNKFSIGLDEFQNLVDSIPDGGYLGITYGLKKKDNNKYSDLSLALLSISTTYKIDVKYIQNGFSISDTANFIDFKKALSPTMPEYNPDYRYTKVIFDKANSIAFLEKYSTLFIDKKVYIYFIYDTYDTTTPFPNALFSNIKDLKFNTNFSTLSRESFVFGNEGQFCCPPPRN